VNPWWQDVAFWRELGPFLFGPDTLASAEDDAADVLGWLDLDDVDDPAAVSLLDAGCGVGRLTVPLAKRGYRVVGLDSVDDFRRDARRRLAAAGISDGNGAEIRAIDVLNGLEDAGSDEPLTPSPLPGGFDAAFCVFALIGYHADPAADLLLVQRIFASLKPGGRFLIMTRHPDASYGKVKHTDPAGALLFEDRRYDKNSGVLHTAWSLTRGGRQRAFRSQLRVYGAADLRGLLEFCGFSRVRVLDHKGEHRLVVIGTRPPETGE
jgi:SAM-dependent methyltransferase